MARARRAVRPRLRHGAQRLCHRLLEARSGLEANGWVLVLHPNALSVTAHHGLADSSHVSPWELSTTSRRAVNRHKFAQSSVSDQKGHGAATECTRAATELTPSSPCLPEGPVAHISPWTARRSLRRRGHARSRPCTHCEYKATCSHIGLSAAETGRRLHAAGEVHELM